MEKRNEISPSTSPKHIVGAEQEDWTQNFGLSTWKEAQDGISKAFKK